MGKIGVFHPHARAVPAVLGLNSSSGTGAAGAWLDTTANHHFLELELSRSDYLFLLKVLCHCYQVLWQHICGATRMRIGRVRKQKQSSKGSIPVYL